MNIEVHPDQDALAASAAARAAAVIAGSIAARGRARVVAATGNSQLAFLAALLGRGEVDWTRVDLFHLDEYVGLGPDHPASFRRYLRERLVEPAGVRVFHALEGDGDLPRALAAAAAALTAAPIDVAFVGIGENGHLAFNDPPADFQTEAPYLVVTLDEACRRQQAGEGWFPSLDDVPARAITMSIRQILKAREILCVVPEARKAAAVQRCLEGPIDPTAPASVLRTHGGTTVYLDRASAARLADRRA